MWQLLSTCVCVCARARAQGQPTSGAHLLSILGILLYNGHVVRSPLLALFKGLLELGGILRIREAERKQFILLLDLASLRVLTPILHNVSQAQYSQ